MSSIDPRMCEWVRDRLDAYCDGAESDLVEDERLRVARHLQSCAACAREHALAQRVRAGLRALAVPAAPAAALERAQREIDARPGNVVRLPARVQGVRWLAAAAALVVIAAAVWVGRARLDRRIAASPEAVEQAAREAAIAFAYVDKYARRTGDIVQDEVIERGLVNPVEKAMEKWGVSETKPGPGQS